MLASIRNDSPNVESTHHCETVYIKLSLRGMRMEVVEGVWDRKGTEVSQEASWRYHFSGGLKMERILRDIEKEKMPGGWNGTGTGKEQRGLMCMLVVLTVCLRSRCAGGGRKSILKSRQ